MSSSNTPTYFNGSNTNLTNFNNAVNNTNPTSFPYTLTDTLSGLDFDPTLESDFVTSLSGSTQNALPSGTVLSSPVAVQNGNSATFTQPVWILTFTGGGYNVTQATQPLTAAQIQTDLQTITQALTEGGKAGLSPPSYPGTTSNQLWQQAVIPGLQSVYNTLTSADAGSPPAFIQIDSPLTNSGTEADLEVASYSFLSASSASSTAATDQGLRNIANGNPITARTGQVSTTTIGGGTSLANFLNVFSSLPSIGNYYKPVYGTDGTTLIGYNLISPQPSIGSGEPTFTTDSAALASPAGQILIKAYADANGIGYDGTNFTLGDWSSLSGAISSVVPNASNPPSQSDINQFVEQNFLLSFQGFVSTYNFNFDTSSNGIAATGNETTDFINAYSSFLTNVATVNTNPVAGAYQSVSINTLYNLYTNFVPGGTQADFAAALSSFYQKEVKTNGYFSPSQDLSDWTKNIQLIGGVVNNTPVTTISNNSSGLSLFFTVFALLVSNTNTLQNVAAAQFNRLTFYSNLAQAYTNLLQQLPQITETKLNSSSSDASDTVTQIQSLNQNYSSILQAYQSADTDEEKSFQTNANNTNEAVTQSTTLLQTLLTNMTSVLQAINQAK